MSARSFGYLLFLALAALPARAGTMVGNGGDAVICREEPGARFTGIFALDYLLTFQGQQQTQTPGQTVQSITARIRRNLVAKVPELVPSFDDFMALVRNRDITRARYWEAAPYGLVDLNDQRIVTSIPPNCRNGQRIQIVQAVIRLFPSFSGTVPQRIVYKYVPSVFDSLASTRPLQLSYLLVHEWLWDVSANVDRNRRLNRYFHSREFESATAAQARAWVLAAGLTIPGVQPPAFNDDVCAPDPATTREIVGRFTQNRRRQRIGSLELFSRERHCAAEVGCGDWRDRNDRYSTYAGPIRFLDFSSDSAIFISGQNGGKKTEHSICKFDPTHATVVCDPFRNDRGGVYGYGGTFNGNPDGLMRLKGTVGVDCVKLFGKGFIRLPWRDGKVTWLETDIVWFHRFPRP